MKKIPIFILFLLAVTMLLWSAYLFVEQYVQEKTRKEMKESYRKEQIEQIVVVDKNYYYENISINGDSVILSQVVFTGMVGDFEDEHTIQKWYCPDKTVRNQISNATIDFHRNPGELKIMANAKGLTNEKYIVNENFTSYIIVEKNEIIKFRKGKKC